MRFKPTPHQRRQAETMAGLGFRTADIAKILDLPPTIVRRHFAAEMKMGALRANVTVANKAYAMATRENASAALVIFWLKTRAGWREPPPLPAPGKKEQADVAAQSAGKGTDWDRLLN